MLVLGGRGFLGRHVVEAALARGWSVASCSREPHPRSDVESVVADRDVSMGSLAGRAFDAVLDLSAKHPAHVRRVASALRRVGHFTLVSSISVYRAEARRGAREDAPVVEPLAVEPALPDRARYAELKVAAEREAERAFDRLSIVRPGVLVGPHDSTDRFPWWVARVRRGGPMLAPGPRSRRVQFLDARDLSAFLIDGVEREREGVWNAVGPRTALSFERLLTRLVAALGSDAEPVWTRERALLDHGLEPFVDVPLWVPRASEGFMRIDGRRAFAQGLRCRPLEDTARDVAAWLGGRVRFDVGLSPEREAALLSGARARAGRAAARSARSRSGR